MSVEDAMAGYFKKQFPPKNTRQSKRQYKKPEKNVEKTVLTWAIQKGFFFHVVDSSSYDPLLGRKGISKVEIGFSDIVGNTSSGLACFVELKAKDRRCRLSPAQRVFLELKIQQNCFAVVVDSVERLEQYWTGFQKQKTLSDRRSYLLECLPKISKRKGAKDDFEKSHGF